MWFDWEKNSRSVCSVLTGQWRTKSLELWPVWQGGSILLCVKIVGLMCLVKTCLMRVAELLVRVAELRG